MVAIIIVLICVGIPVGGGLLLAAWRDMLKARPDDPLAILAARYAAGEINEGEYSRRLQVLTGNAYTELPES